MYMHNNDFGAFHTVC